jgi:hypothetical protein
LIAGKLKREPAIFPDPTVSGPPRGNDPVTLGDQNKIISPCLPRLFGGLPVPLLIEPGVIIDFSNHEPRVYQKRVPEKLISHELS